MIQALIFLAEASASAGTYVIPAIAALLSGALVAIITQIFGKRKTEAETTEIVTKAAAQVLGNYADDNKRLRAQVIALENDNRELKRKYNRVNAELRDLKAMMRQAGLDPERGG